MPCVTDRPSGWIDVDGEVYAVVVRLACDRCKEIEARGGEVPGFAKDWWESHKIADARRLAGEELAQRQEGLRRNAIAKLTPEERAELGV